MARTRVVGYVRVSTEGQAEEGVSLDAQRAKLQGYANLYDLDLVAVEEDAGVSAKSLARPGLESALARLESGEVEGLLVSKLDRLTRSVRDLGTLLDRGLRDRWALLSVQEQVDTRSAGGRLVLNVLCSVAQWERETGAERTSEALRHLKAEGVRLGAEALGWKRAEERDQEGRRLVAEVHEEAAVVARVLELAREGHSHREVARRLAAEGRATKRGGAWTHKQVAAVLRRAAAEVAA